MHNKNMMVSVVLAVLTVFFAILTFSSYQHTKAVERQFNEKKATLVKENLDLKERLDSMQYMVNQKTESITVLESEKKALQDRIKELRDENDSLINTGGQLKKKSALLKRKIAELENSPISEQIRAAIEQEQNAGIKKVLEDSIRKIELVKSGKSVNLEPIVVTRGQAQAQQQAAAGGYNQGERVEKAGVILSVDRQNNLAVINLGKKDDVEEGNRCLIIKDDQEIAQAEVINTRYRIAAVFINDIMSKYTINDIKENLKVRVQ